MAVGGGAIVRVATATGEGIVKDVGVEIGEGVSVVVAINECGALGVQEVKTKKKIVSQPRKFLILLSS